MPWRETTQVATREEFVRLALADDSNVSLLCERFGISRKTGYKWMAVYRSQGRSGLADRSRRPHHSPRRVAVEIEQAILQHAERYPAWGARKLQRLLARDRPEVPSVSTVQAVLKRHGRVCTASTEKNVGLSRFEHPQPNDLWQMDFKCSIACRPHKAHALTVVDDHSRFNICLRACADQQTETVQRALTDSFRTYGMPYRMTMDNGSPWGDSSTGNHTRLTIWLMKLGIRVSHSRPYHPQTQGKDERFHRTLNVEVLQHRHFDSIPHMQRVFDHWRPIYNTVRPHEGIGLLTPIDRYSASHRVFPETLPGVEYDTTDIVRKVSPRHTISYMGKSFFVGHAFTGEYVAVRRSTDNCTIKVFFGTHLLRTFDLSIHTP